MRSLAEYRRSEEAARDVAEKLLVDERIRRGCLMLLADAIIQAHCGGSSPAAWAVTLGSTGFIRLNVGAIEVYALLKDTVHIVLDAGALADDERAGQHAAAVQTVICESDRTSGLVGALAHRLLYLSLARCAGLRAQ